MVAAVAAALASALGFAVSTSLQHRAAGNAAEAPPHRLLAHLACQPAWVIGLAVGGLAFALHAVAVAYGTLGLVQPIVVSGVVLALPVRAALDRRPVRLREIGWAALAATGLTLFVVVLSPSAGTGLPHKEVAAWLVATGLSLAALATYAGVRMPLPNHQGLLLGGAAGVLFGLVAGAMKMTAATVSADGILPAATDWPLLVVLASGFAGVALNQRAYQVSRLSISMPLLNIVDIVVATAFGSLVFVEVPAHRPVELLAEAVGLGLTAFGVWQLARRGPEDIPPPVPNSPAPSLALRGP